MIAVFTLTGVVVLLLLIALLVLRYLLPHRLSLQMGEGGGGMSGIPWQRLKKKAELRS